MDLLPGAWVLEAFRRGGVDVEELTRRSPDDVNTLIYHMDIISPDCTSRLLDACADLTGNTAFGLHMNDLVDITMYGLFGYLLLNSGTVKDLFNTLERYYVIHHDAGDYYKVTTQRKTVTIEYGFDLPMLVCPRHSIEWALGFIPHYLKPSLGEPAKPSIAQFTHSAPHNLGPLHAVFGTNLEFDQSRSQLIYPRSILNDQIANIDPVLSEALHERADKHLYDHLAKGSMLKRIRVLLLENLSLNETNASDIAKSLNMSLSTFKRKLVEEGIDFKGTKESIKNELARQLLSQTDKKVSVIAQQVGFSNQSAFTRFFARCNQLKPLEYRNRTDKNGS